MAKKICDNDLFVAIQTAIEAESAEGDKSLVELAEKYPEVMKALGYEHEVEAAKERLNKDEANHLRLQAEDSLQSANLVIDQTPKESSYRPASNAVQTAREAVKRAVIALGSDSMWVPALRRDFGHLESRLRNLKDSAQRRHQKVTPVHKRRAS